MTSEMILTIELVPKSSWFDNLRKALAKSEWDRLRKKVYADHDYRCAVCKSSGILHCHEIWNYDDLQHIQKLVGFVALCRLCHHVKHLALALMLAEAGRLDFEGVIRHFMKVNRCSRSAFEEYRHLAFLQWEERSKHPWQVDYGNYEELLRRR